MNYARTALFVFAGVVLTGGLAANTAAAQVQVVEENQAGSQVVERGYVQGQGRGIQYGAHLVSPILLTDFVRSDVGERILPGGGLGIRARIGWEFPSGFTAEIYGGLGVNGVDTEGMERSSSLITADVGVGARYMFFNETAFVPFVQLGLGIRYYDIEWPSGAEEDGDPSITLPLHVAVGAQIELSPYFGIEFGVMADYAVGLDVLQDGVFVLTPFAGVTLYVYDEDD